MKRRAYGYSRWRWRLGGYMFLGLAFVIFALVKLQDSVTHEEVHPPQIRNPLKPKLAFLFLARHVMPLDILWEHFFQVWLFPRKIKINLTELINMAVSY
jgi:hypothetical protein